MNPTRHQAYKARGRSVDVRGVVVHDAVVPNDWSAQHTADRLAYGVRHGTTRVPPPLYHYIIGPEGDVIQMAAETVRANHAGRNDPTALATFKAGQADWPDAFRPAGPGHRRSNGNRWSLGIGLSRWGDLPVPDDQYAALVALLDDICVRHGFSPNQIVGHRNLTTRKIDPRRLDLDELRHAVVHGPQGPPPAPDPEPPTLRIGHSSGWVRRVQRRLAYSWLMSHDDVTGRFDARTERAVKQYQLVSWLVADGIVGPQTWRALTPPDQRKDS